MNMSDLIQFETLEVVDIPAPKKFKYPIHLHYGYLKNINTNELYKNKVCCKICFENRNIKTYQCLNHTAYEHLEKNHKIKIRNKDQPVEKKAHFSSPNVSEIWNRASSVATTPLRYEKDCTTSKIEQILGEGVIAPDSCIISTSSAISPAQVAQWSNNTDVDVVPDVDAMQPLGAKQIVPEKNNAANAALRQRLIENGRCFGNIIGRWLGELPENDQQQSRIFQKIQQIIMEEIEP